MNVTATAPQPEPRRTSWRFAGASILSSLITFGLAALYGNVHTNILVWNYLNMPDAERHKWLLILGVLEIYRLAGLVAVILAALALTRRPRWPAIVYVPLAFLAGWFSLLII